VFFQLNFNGRELLSGAMSSANYLVRRAVIDDLPVLIPLWRGMNFVPEELEKRLTDFQVAVDGQGTVLGAVAFEVAGQQGRIHHEAFGDFGVADAVRPLFWDKIQMLALNNTVFRVWTQEDAPFWRQIGLQPAAREVQQKLPAKWSAQGQWFTLQLKEEAAIKVLSGEGEFEAILREERAASQEALERRTRTIKTAATVIAILLAALVGALVIYAIKRDPSLLNRFR
jgi:hypothetical protein